MLSLNRNTTQFRFVIVLLISLGLLVGCGQESAESDAAPKSAASSSVATVPATSEVAEQEPAAEQQSQAADNADVVALYQRTCLACHAPGAAGAPRTGDKAAWQSRLAERGIDGLVDSAINGMGSMPPTGLCGQCTPEDFKALIVYMMD